MTSQEKKAIEIQGNSRTVFLAIAENRFDKCSVTGPARGASVGGLIKRGLINKTQDGYALTDAGKSLYSAMRPAKTETTEAKAGEPKAPKAKKAKEPKGPSFNERTAKYIRQIRAELGGAVEHLTDEAIAKKVWRFTPATVIERVKQPGFFG
jgi:hypothetical protein